jgi:hypothetical protein
MMLLGEIFGRNPNVLQSKFQNQVSDCRFGILQSKARIVQRKLLHNLAHLG